MTHDHDHRDRSSCEGTHDHDGKCANHEESSCESVELVRKLGTGAPGPADLDRATALATEAVDAVEASPSTPAADDALGRLVNVVPVLVKAARMDLVEQLLGRVIKATPATQVPTVHLRDALANALLAAFDPAHPRGTVAVVHLAQRLNAMTAGSLDGILAGVARDAAKALHVAGHGALRDEVFAILESSTPPSAGDVVAWGHQAGAWADRLVIDLSQGHFDQVESIVLHLEALASKSSSAEVATELAAAYACCLDANMPTPRVSPTTLKVWVERGLALLTAHRSHRALARNILSGAGPATLVLHCLGDTEGLVRAVSILGGGAEAFGGDEELAFSLARVLVNLAILRCPPDDHGPVDRLFTAVRRWMAPPDLVLQEARKAMGRCVAAVPKSRRIAGARGRFERITGRPIPVGPDARPVPHADIENMADAFDAIQVQGPDAALEERIFAVVGTGPYLPRVRREGEGVYRSDETYFIDLIEEIERQIHEGGGGFWDTRQPQIEAMTRYLIEDATTAVADCARRLRSHYRMPPR